MSTFQLRVESNLHLHWCSLEQFPLSVESYPIWIDFALLRSVIGPVNQSDAKLKPITSWSPAFSRALGSLLAFTLSFHWFFKGIFLSSDWPPLRQLLVLVLQHLLKSALLHVFVGPGKFNHSLDQSDAKLKKLQFVLTYFFALQAVCLVFLWDLLRTISRD